ncbi:homoserine dehydrogenase [Virgibacillus sp. YIM 98842]|uniref:homoserine dehydrogenase n=1 Tax=Virgibacillus sp. YIM 98842 TaxID=2663533 RepID=UPI0013DCAA3D|nr:homoserine dehydrogenase [Virgibacillus sp. YIM 98842]
MESNVSIGLLGLGVVGSGVIKLIENHQKELAHKLGCAVQVKSVLVRNPDKARDVNLNRTLLTTNPDDILNDPEIDIIVEVMGGIEESYKHILKAFAAKKHVVTANKDLVALHGIELQETATENKCDFYYEASVAGGIPILRGIAEGLSSDRIQKVMGIVNGTTNYILTKMSKEGVSYTDALNEAQELGFAEADPTADVEGLDAARKMAILGRLSFSTNVSLDDVEVKGISHVDLEDIHYGDKLGYNMKLIGFAQCEDEQVEVHVQPTLLAKSHPLAQVKDEYNAVYVYGEAVGETMFYGPGAGSMPTATAVVSDIVSITKNIRLNVNGAQAVPLRFERKLKSPEEQYSDFYMRLHVKDEAGVFSTISSLFHEHDISFKRILQTPMKKLDLAEIIFVTHETTLGSFRKAMEELYRLDVVLDIKSHYKVEGDVDDELAGTAETL